MRTLNASLASAALSACATAPDPLTMVEVGWMERDCMKVVNTKQLVTIPVGFKVTPVEAAQMLPKPRGCNTKFFFSVYADERNYYFVDNGRVFLQSRTAELVRTNAYVVNGQSGALLSEPPRTRE